MKLLVDDQLAAATTGAISEQVVLEAVCGLLTGLPWPRFAAARAEAMLTCLDGSQYNSVC